MRGGPRRADAAAAAIGLAAAFCLLACGLALLGLLSRAQCGGESRPFLGSGRQAFAIYGCLQRDAGPLIALKKRLGLYDPAWRTVIK